MLLKTRIKLQSDDDDHKLSFDFFLMREIIFIIEKMAYDVVTQDELNLYISGFSVLLRKIQVAPLHLRTNFYGALGN